jgi:hypothetical protein
MAVVKKYFSSKRPRGEARYLLAVTRLTVLSCSSTASATSRRISGRRNSTPWRKKASCRRTISAATLMMVLPRCSRLFTSQLADCRCSATKDRAALSFSDTVARAAKPRLTSTRGIVSGLSSRIQSPSGPARISTSGSSACIGWSSPPAPGLGSSRRSSATISARSSASTSQAAIRPRMSRRASRSRFVEQALHAGVPAAQLAQLHLQAFAQVATEHADGLEALHRLADIFDHRNLAAEPRRQCLRVQRQPAARLHHGEQGGGDQPVPPLLEAEPDLLGQAPEAEILAEIDAAHALVGDDLARAPLRQHAAGMDDVGAVDEAERLAHVVVGDQHADAAAGQVLHEVLDVAHRDRVDAGEGLVEQHEGGLARQRPGDLAAPPLAARERDRGRGAGARC